MTRISSRLVTVSAGVALALLGPAAVADAAPVGTMPAAPAAAAYAAPVAPIVSPVWQDCMAKLDGVSTRVARTMRTVTVVNQTAKTWARVSFWVRTESACSFSRKFLTTKARLGYGGTVEGTKRKQGTGTTPRGAYRMSEAFGNGSAPTTAMPFHVVQKGDYWVGDNASKYYNSLRNKSQGGFRWKLGSSSINASEYLPSYASQYRYSVVIDFNRAPDYRQTYRGTGIFLHVKGSGATGGCVGVSKDQMKMVLRYLQPGDKIKIVA